MQEYNIETVMRPFRKNNLILGRRLCQLAGIEPLMGSKSSDHSDHKLLLRPNRNSYEGDIQLESGLVSISNDDSDKTTLVRANSHFLFRGMNYSTTQDIKATFYQAGRSASITANAMFASNKARFSDFELRNNVGAPIRFNTFLSIINDHKHVNRPDELTDENDIIAHILQNAFSDVSLQDNVPNITFSYSGMYLSFDKQKYHIDIKTSNLREQDFATSIFVRGSSSKETIEPVLIDESIDNTLLLNVMAAFNLMCDRILS